jgi:hypothetical protein
MRAPEPERIPDLHHLKRQIRYVHLNPCRARLAGDPLQWEWSTHRDLAGCVSDPWPDPELLRHCFQAPRARLAEAAHAYISSDPSVTVTGSPSIREYRDGEPILVDLPSFARAAASIRRVAFGTREARVLAVHAANRLRLVPDPKKLGISPRTWERIVARPRDEAEVRRLLKVLADSRCR